MAEINANEVNSMLVQGFKAAKEGRRAEAYKTFCEIVNINPNNEFGWLYRAATAEDLTEAYACLQRVIKINPKNDKAVRGIERIKARISEETQTAETETGFNQDRVTASSQDTRLVGNNEVVSGFGISQLQSPKPQVPPTPQQDLPGNKRERWEDSLPGASSNQPEPFSIPPFGSQPSFETETSQSIGAEADDSEPVYFIPPPDTHETASFQNYAVSESDSDEDFSIQAPPLELPDLRGLRQKPKKRGRRKENPPIQENDGQQTDLGDLGRQRLRQQRRTLGIMFLLMAAIVLVLGIFLVSKNLSTPTTQNNIVIPKTDSKTANPTTIASIGVTTSATSGEFAGVITATSLAATTSSLQVTATLTVTAVLAESPTSIPATPSPGATTQVTAKTAAQVRAIIHQVKAGDNLTKLAKTYNTSLEAIIAANSDSAALLQTVPLIGTDQGIYANTRLVIPAQRPEFRGKALIVKQGDTLEAIATRYKVQADDILRINGLTSSSDIKPNDPLLVP